MIDNEKNIISSSLPAISDNTLPATIVDSKPKDILLAYLQEIRKLKPLDQATEVMLARKIRDEQDEQAAFQLISANLRLVIKIAMEFHRKWTQNVLDLIQEGNIGLMRAVQKFDPEKGIKFSYYASFWVKAYIIRFIMDNWRMVKVGTTQAQRKLFFNLAKEKRRLESLGFASDSSAISNSLNVSVQEVEEMQQRLGQQDLSLNAPVGIDGDTTHIELLPSGSESVENTLANREIQVLLRKRLDEIIPNLTPREQEILQLRILSDTPMTLRELGEKYNITRERIRQLEAKLLEKIKKHFTKSFDDFSKNWINHG